MEKVNNTVRAYAQVLTFLAIWLGVLFVKSEYSAVDFWVAIRNVPIAITIYLFVGVLFTRWIWRWKIFKGWLVKLPNLQGTWRGELKSDWIDPATGQQVPPIPVILVRQTFSTIRCIQMTLESTSYSTTAAINAGFGGDELFLTYNYTNRPRISIQDRSAIHDGAALLKIITKPNRGLEGEYWTSRKTRGEISLVFESKTLLEKFESQ